MILVVCLMLCPGRIHGTDKEKDLFQMIIRGCLQVDPTKRWTIKHVVAVLLNHLSPAPGAS